MNTGIRKVAATGGALLLAATSAGLLGRAVEKVAVPSEGKNYLEQRQICTNAQNEGFRLLVACGEGDLARVYKCDINGKPVRRTVCFGLFGPYRPLLGD